MARALAASAVVAAVAAVALLSTRGGEPQSVEDDVAEAARAHRVVLIGERHGWAELHALLRRLVASDEVAAHVDDIVVEFGNARHQALVDAYVAGEDVPVESVARAWRATTQQRVWESPVYAAFFAAVRRRNTRPGAKQLRVVLGDPPVPAGLDPDDRRHDFWVLQRDAHFATVVHREVLSRGRRALVVAGAGHVVRPPGGMPTLTNLLEGNGRCETDPLSIEAGVDWCDDLRRYQPVDAYVFVAVPAAAADEPVAQADAALPVSR